jgi:hypothetical protein
MAEGRMWPSRAVHLMEERTERKKEPGTEKERGPGQGIAPKDYFL